MTLNMSLEQWKAGIPQRELEKKIKEYEESLPEREKMTAQARENNQTRFFLEDRFYELHKKELADMMKKQAAASGLLGFREGNQGIIPIAKSSSEGANVGFTPHPTSPTLGEGVDSAYSGGGQNSLVSFGTENQGVLPVTKSSLGGYASPAGGGLEASALTAPSYGAAVPNQGQQFAGGYGNGYAQPAAVAGVNPLSEVRNIATPQPEQVQNDADVSWEDYLKYATAAALQGYTLGFSDEIYGLGGALKAGVDSWRAGQNVWDGMKNGYIENRDDARAYLNEARERAPNTVYAAEFGASLFNPLSKLKYLQVSKNLPRLTKMARNMRSNIVTSGVYGLGQGEGDVENQLATAAKGVAMGLGTDLLVRGANRYIPIYTGPTYRLPLYNATASLGVDKAWNSVQDEATEILKKGYQNYNLR